MNTIAFTVSLEQKDMDKLISRYHFQKTDKDMLKALCKSLTPLLDIHAYYLTDGNLENVDIEQYAAVFLTLGDGIDALQDIYLRRNHVSEAYMLECIGLELLTKAYETFAGQVQMAMGKRAVRLHFLGDKYPFTIMDEMRRQMGEINISFNEQYNMTPQKSVAFLLELADTGETASELAGEEQLKHTHNALCHVHLAHICADCKNVDCEYRQKENYTYGYQRIFGGQRKKG